MYAGVVVCVVIAAVSAGQIPLLKFGKSMPPTIKVDKREPEKCCAEPYYTYKAHTFLQSVKDDAFLAEVVLARGAYDSLDKKIGVEFVEDFSNGTEYVFKLISDFKEGIGYVSYKEEGQIICHKFDLASAPFPYLCLSEESKYVGAVTIGSRKLQVDQWYFNDVTTDEDAHLVISIKHPECVGLGYVGRVFHPSTGVEISTDTTSIFDYNLGICDPDKWFKPPPECEGSTLKQEKTIPKRVLGLRGPGGKRIFE